MNPMKKLRRASAALLLLGTTALPAQAQDNIAQQVVAALEQAGADAATIANLAARQVMQGLTEWNEATFNDVLNISQQYGVALDALIPSVQGCITEQDGTPLVATSVVGYGMMPGTIGSAIPMMATTSGEGVPATVFGIVIDPSYLSENQRENWGPGCYWMPVPPGWVELVYDPFHRGEEMMSLTVFPLSASHMISPPGKIVYGFGDDVSITHTDNPFNINGASHTRTETTAD